MEFVRGEAWTHGRVDAWTQDRRRRVDAFCQKASRTIGERRGICRTSRAIRTCCPSARRIYRHASTGMHLPRWIYGDARGGVDAGSSSAGGCLLPKGIADDRRTSWDLPDVEGDTGVLPLGEAQLPVRCFGGHSACPPGCPGGIYVIEITSPYPRPSQPSLRLRLRRRGLRPL